LQQSDLIGHVKNFKKQFQNITNNLLQQVLNSNMLAETTNNHIYFDSSNNEIVFQGFIANNDSSGNVPNFNLNHFR